MQFSQHFTYGKILSAVLSPIIMMMFTSLYSVADGLFLSNFAGKEAFAAVGFMTPYLMMFNSVGFLFGTGGSALIAKMLGEKNGAEANETFSTLVLASALTGLLLSVIGQLFLKPVALFQGAQGALLENALLYGRLYLLGTPACLIQFEFQALYQTSGKGRLGLKAAVLSGLTNIVLDALLLAGFSLGTAGAAAGFEAGWDLDLGGPGRADDGAAGELLSPQKPITLPILNAEKSCGGDGGGKAVPPGGGAHRMTWGVPPPISCKGAMSLSFSIQKSIANATMPPKGENVVTVTLTMESELVAKPRDILIAWDEFGREINLKNLPNMEAAIGTVLDSLVSLTGGANGQLGNGSRVAFYGNQSNSGEIRTAFSSDVSVVKKAVQTGKAAPQPGLHLAADSLVEMLASTTNRKTLLVCNLTQAMAQNTAERDKLVNAGAEIFTLGDRRETEPDTWGGEINSSMDPKGAAANLAGIPQNLLIEDLVYTQFKRKDPITATRGEAHADLAVLGKPYPRVVWEVGLPEMKAGVQTDTLTYAVEDKGPEVGEQDVSKLIVQPQDAYTGFLGEQLPQQADSILKVTITGDPNPGGGTDPDPNPNPGGGTDPDPTPTPTPGGYEVKAEAWPAPMAVTAEHCKDAVQATVPDAQILSLGRLVQLDVVLKNICPGKRVSATVLLTETDAAGMEQTRAVKHILVPAQTGTVCADVTLRCIQFSVPEALDLTGQPDSICNERKFNVRVIANYVDSDMVFCDTSTVNI